jgi:hypothetical protein
VQEAPKTIPSGETIRLPASIRVDSRREFVSRRVAELGPQAHAFVIECVALSFAARRLAFAVKASASGAGLADLVVRTLSLPKTHLDVAVRTLSLATNGLDDAVRALSLATKHLAPAIGRFDVAAKKVAANAMASAFAVREVTLAAKGLALDARRVAPAARHLTIAHRSLTATADCVAVDANDLTANDSHVVAAVATSIARVDGFVARTGRVGPFVDDVTRRANGFDSFVVALVHGVVARAVHVSSRAPSTGHLTEGMHDHGSTVRGGARDRLELARSYGADAPVRTSRPSESTRRRASGRTPR